MFQKPINHLESTLIKERISLVAPKTGPVIILGILRDCSQSNTIIAKH
jgi:hypothetical protein